MSAITIHDLLFFCLPVAILLVLFVFIITGVRILKLSTQWKAEWYRKIAHVYSSAGILLAIVYLDQLQMILFSLGLICGAVFWEKTKLESIDIDRDSYGALLYALSILILSLLVLPEHKDSFAACILILGVSDTLAALVGQRFGKQIPRFEKSTVGSLTFFFTVFVVYAMLPITWIHVLSLSVLTTIIEFISKKGIDNIAIPLLVVMCVSVFI